MRVVRIVTGIGTTLEDYVEVQFENAVWCMCSHDLRQDIIKFTVVGNKLMVVSNKYTPRLSHLSAHYLKIEGKTVSHTFQSFKQGTYEIN